MKKRFRVFAQILHEGANMLQQISVYCEIYPKICSVLSKFSKYFFL
jgi:hypothetical protein